MGTEEYEVLLWILGDRVTQFNFMAASLLTSWALLSLSYHTGTRLWRYIDFRLDSIFWKETLMLDGPDDRPRRNGKATSLDLFEWLQLH
jgi:hypothetical protein